MIAELLPRMNISREQCTRSLRKKSSNSEVLVFRLLARRFLKNCFPLVALLLMAATSHAALDINVQATPDPVEPGEVLNVQVTVGNSDNFDRTDVVVTMEYPAGLNALAHSAISDGGSCVNSVGNGSTCSSTEQLSWSIASLPANSGITLTLPPTVDASTATGTTIVFQSTATDSSDSATGSESVEVVNDRTLELALSEVADPVVPGGELTYVLSFGHTASSAVATNAVLELPLPAGVSFVSATGGGTLVGNTVQWSLGTLQPGAVGEREVRVTVDAAQGLGTAIKAEAQLSSGGLLTRADAVTRIESQVPLQVVIEANANPAQSGEALNVELTATNTSAFDRSNVQLVLRYPVGLNALAHSAISDGGSCVNSVGNGSTCSSTEQLIWDLGTIAAGSGVTVTLPPSINAALPRGSLIEFVAVVLDATARARAIDVVRVGDDAGITLVAVPSFEGMSQSAAEAAILAANLSVGTVTEASSDSVAVGNVISQSPAAGIQVAEGARVDLVISTGPADTTVPGVVGLSQSDAEAAIIAAGLTVGTVTSANSDTVATGDVISQSPAGGTDVALSTEVDLVVSLGPLLVSVPDVGGLTQSAAEAAIIAEGLTIGTVTSANSDAVPAGDVISQSPAPGTSVSANTTVDLIISLGPVAADSDGDNVADDNDNCINVANPSQRDTDGDGFGNDCDTDLNNDGTTNIFDLGLLKRVLNTADPDADFNGDGVVDQADIAILRSFFLKAPGPSAIAPAS